MTTGRGSLLLDRATLICALVLANHISAQTFTVLHTFTYTDGTGPFGGLVLSGNTLYGTASGGGGDSFSGALFKVRTDGTGFTTLHSFSRVTETGAPPYINSDGANPDAGLIFSGNTLYGTASIGGSSGWGTLFALNTDGTGFTTLHWFTGTSDGASPKAGYFYWKTPCMERRAAAGRGRMARCLSSTRTAQVLPICTLSAAELTEATRMPD